MFGKRVTLFRLFGFSVHVDLSWMILAFLVAWTLAVGVFPYYYEGLSTGQYWGMGVAGTAGLFLSIVFHGMTHSLVGCVGTRSVKELPREEWGSRIVKEIAKECSEENSIGPDADALQALSVMSRNGNSRLLVTENGQLEGIIALKDMMEFFSLKLDLEEDAARE